MAFDQVTRGRLQRFVNEARWAMEEEFTRQLQNDFGLDPGSGEVTPLEQLRHLDDAQRETARILRETLAHYRASEGNDEKAGLNRIVREQAFTVVNRLAALRMAEARGLIIESVGHGYQAKGFQLYARLAAAGLGETGEAYRSYLFSTFDELACDLPGLFDRYSPQGRLFPRESALQAFLGLINDDEIEALWSEDETIGWIYQYFNSKEERKAMRDASQAPRNSRELAVRNQFFTPRYVVEFLADNTLGQLWYEMTKGQTSLKRVCRLLALRQNTVLLAEGQAVPKGRNVVNASQQQLLQQPIYISHRPLRDPREIRVLDPACGSMHFGLYCFDLFEVIYHEAWEMGKRFNTDPTLASHFSAVSALVDEYPDKNVFLAAVPRLIIEHNLHGIDIDPRAIQIAGLSMWLRAQRAWREYGVQPSLRPRISRTNIVCAEAMPGEEAMLRDFIDTTLSASPEQRLLGHFVNQVFDAMRLAGEAGALLRIEEDIANAVLDAKTKWVAAAGPAQSRLFPDESALSYRAGDRFDMAAITDAMFWEQAESRIYEALHEYARRSDGGGYQRRLFLDDAARGFAFIDLCQKRFDVVLMNPPFGAFPASADELLNKTFPTCRGDFYPAFIERWNSRTEFLGAITNRTGLSLKGLEEWRQSNLLGQHSLVLLADLGMNVLDALVEAAAYVITRSSCEPLVAIDCLDMPGDRMALRLLEAVGALRDSAETDFVFLRNRESFARLPAAPISYRAPNSIIQTFSRFPLSERDELKFRVTSPNYDDFRYLRLKWEVLPQEIGRQYRWSPIAKGGEYAPYYSDLDLLIDWDDKAQSFRGFLGTVHRPLTRPACADLFFTGGLTWSERTASRFSPRVLPEGAIFSSVGPYCGGRDSDEMLFVLGVLMSAPYQAILEMFLAAGDSTSSGSAARHYQVGALRNLPFPDFPQSEKATIREGVRTLVASLQRRVAGCESSSLFESCAYVRPRTSLPSAIDGVASRDAADIQRALAITKEIDALVARRYEIDADGLNYIATLFGRHPTEYPICVEMPAPLLEDMHRPIDDVIQRSVQCGKTGRFITVKSYYADRKLEVLAHRHHVSALSILPSYVKTCLVPAARREAGETIASYILGCAFGRWDVRLAAEGSNGSGRVDPFESLPVCAPGHLTNRQGLPLTKDDVAALRKECGWDYPIDVPWEGVLVDSADNPLDIEARVLQVLRIIWQNRWEETERDLCENLGVRTLREYYRKPAGFFAYHQASYSKSRRQAPIYWPLSTSSGSYTLWIYCHRITTQTLYHCINNFVEPKMRQVADNLLRLRKMGADRNAGEEKSLEELEEYDHELREFNGALLELAGRWRPDLNDGVQITAAPLWPLFRHKPWQKVLKDTWGKLEKGEYDWAHLAMSHWPERVREKCKTDKSLAIAHGLETLYVEPAANSKKKRGKRKSRDDE